MKCCAIIPVYNNAGTIEDVVRRTKAIVGKDVLVVSDGSTDRSGDKAEVCGAEVLRLSPNQGKGNALQTGFGSALERGYTHAVTLDADGQHLPEQIPLLLAAAQASPERIWIGSRRMDEANTPAASRKGRAISNFWASLDGFQRVHDAQCGFRLYPLEPVLGLGCKESGFPFEMEVLIRAAWRGIRVGHVAIEVYYPTEGRVSHFDMRRDNVRFSWLSFRLFWGMLLRLPVLSGRALMRVFSRR